MVAEMALSSARIRRVLHSSIAWLSGVAAKNQEIGRTNAEPQKRFNEIRKAVEKSVDMKACEQKFARDDPTDREVFEVFAWPGLLEAAHAEMWPR
jgi:hypothetical protein